MPSNSTPIAALPPPAAETPASPPLAAERKLFSYLAEIQGGTLAANKAAHLANPAVLAGETVRRMQGFFDRARHVEDMRSKKAQTMTSDTGESQMTAKADPSADPHGGPAREPLGRTDSERRVSASHRTSLAELQRTSDVLFQIMHFTVEAHFVSAATTGGTRAANTLIRGQ